MICSRIARQVLSAFTSCALLLTIGFQCAQACTGIRLFAADDSQIAYQVNPYDLHNFSVEPPFSLFMRRTLWATAATELADRYPEGRLRNVIPSGRLVVLEVPRDS